MLDFSIINSITHWHKKQRAFREHLGIDGITAL